MDTDMNKYNSKWVEFHIRDHLKDGEISVRHTVIEEYVYRFVRSGSLLTSLQR